MLNTNANKLKKMNPTQIADQAKNFELAQKVLRQMNRIVPLKYDALNPQNKSLAWGIFFKCLFKEYMEYLEDTSNDQRKPTPGKINVNRITISSKEYEELPKQYRGIFFKDGVNTYVLRENNLKLEDLLESARLLLPVIYKTRWADGDSKNNVKEPAFVSQKSIKAHFVDDRQMDAILKLINVFTQIDSITDFKNQENNQKIGARGIYSKYQNELTNKNRYLQAQRTINNAGDKGIQVLIQMVAPEQKSGLQVLAEYARRNYEPTRQRVIAEMVARVK